MQELAFHSGLSSAFIFSPLSPLPPPSQNKYSLRLLPTMRPALRSLTPTVAKRNMATTADTSGEGLYKMVMANNATYILVIVGTAAAITGGFSLGVNSFWEFNNAGKLYHHVDWSRFAEDDDDDDDDDDDE